MDGSDQRTKSTQVPPEEEGVAICTKCNKVRSFPTAEVDNEHRVCFYCANQIQTTGSLHLIVGSIVVSQKDSGQWYEANSRLDGPP